MCTLTSITLEAGMVLRFATHQGRAQLVVGEGTHLVDLEQVSNGLFSSDPMQSFARWAELREFARTITAVGEPFDPLTLDAPSPRPAQLFGIGLNYRSHATETGAPIPTSPLTFTKFASAINSPYGDIPIKHSTVDWEVELVVVISTGGRDISVASAWDHIAGVCVGQDISDRALQMATQPPQFNLGKSRQGYAPFGPWITDSAHLANRDALRVTCLLNSQEVQNSNTDDLIFPVDYLVSYLSGIVELSAGDVIYTGTPSGVGAARTPPQFLSSGDILISAIEGVCSITNLCI